MLVSKDLPSDFVLKPIVTNGRGHGSNEGTAKGKKSNSHIATSEIAIRSNSTEKDSAEYYTINTTNASSHMLLRTKLYPWLHRHRGMPASRMC
jgi:hypothetical protein